MIQNVCEDAKSAFRVGKELEMGSTFQLAQHRRTVPHQQCSIHMNMDNIQTNIQFKVCSLMRSCLAGSAPHYLRAFCTPVSSLHSRSSLRSSTRGYLVVPRVRTSTAQSRSFAIVGPNSWNQLPQSLRTDLFSISFDQFRKRLKTSLYQ